MRLHSAHAIAMLLAFAPAPAPSLGRGFLDPPKASSSASITGEELQFRAIRDAELSATLERSYEWTLRTITLYWRDKVDDLSAYHPSLRLRGEHEARWSDCWERVRDEQPTVYQRTIDVLGSQFEWEWTFGAWEAKSAGGRLTSVLVDTTLRATRDDEGWVFETLTPKWLCEDDWDGLAGAVGWCGLLPGVPVAAGTRWFLSGEKVHELLRPLGRPRMELESCDGQYPELFALLCRLLDPGELLQFGDDDQTVRYLSTVDGVAELELVLDSDERFELADRARAVARALEIDEETRGWLDRATLDVDVEGGGRLRWSTAESRPISAELEGTMQAELSLLISAPWEMEVRVELDGEFRQSLSFTHSAPEAQEPAHPGEPGG